MLTRDVHKTLEQGVRIQHARRVVGVDDHNGFGARCDFGLDICQVRHPVVGLIAQVMHGRATRQAGSCRPQGIVRHGQQQLVAIVEQRVGRHGDQLAGTIAQVNIVERHALDALLLRLMHNGLARRENAFAV